MAAAGAPARAPFTPTALDVLEVNNLISTFVQCLDSGDGPALAALFADGGTVDVRSFGKVHGGTNKDEIEAFCYSVHAKFPNTQHWEGNVCIVFDAVVGESGNPRATNRSYWQALSGSERVSCGWHRDVIEKIGGRWLFVTREVEHTNGGFKRAGGDDDKPRGAVVDAAD